MHQISKSAIVPYSPKQMFALVNAVEHYPKFLNWCQKSEILKTTENEIIASITVSKSGFGQTFSTINTLFPFEKIEMRLKDGPFEKLSGAWYFENLDENGCQVRLNLVFGFSSKFTDLLLAKSFAKIAGSQLDAFVKRAQAVYGDA